MTEKMDPSPPQSVRPPQQAQDGQSRRQTVNDGQGAQSQQPQPPRVGLPEWVSFGIGLAVVVATTAILVLLYLTGDSAPPLIVVEPANAAPGETQTVAEMYVLPIFVENVGGQTAEDVLVQLTLESEQGAQESVSFTVRFLSPRERQIVTVQFQNDPAQGTLSHVVSFMNP